MSNNVTKKEIAEYLGISRTTVSLVLNNVANTRISASTRKKVWEAANLLGYRDVYYIRAKNMCFILYNRESDDPRYVSLLECIEETAAKNGYNLLFMNIRQNAKDLNRLKEFLDKKETDFIIISGDIDDVVINLLNKSGVLFYVYGHISHLNVNSFMLDSEKVAYEGVKYLIDRGHKRIAFFTGSLDSLIHKMNYKGYKKALEENNITYDGSLVQVSESQDGVELLNRCQHLGVNCSAIFCVNTVIQFSALMRAKEKRINVPFDLSIMGIGYSKLVEISNPSLSTIMENHSEAVKILFKRIISTIENPTHKRERIVINLESKFHEGGTVGII